MEHREAAILDKRSKLGLLVVSGATIVAIVVAALQENYFAEWHHFRRDYADLLEDKANDDAGRAAAEQFSPGVVQNYVPALGVVDRCITCHAGVEDPRMADVEPPFRTHPGSYLALHDPAKFGCTVCHLGQGRGTTVADAHGHVPHWDWPMLELRYVKSSCTQCHDESALLGANGLIARADGEDPGEWGDWLLADGRWLATERGCLGCHVLDGKGGTLGPDLTRVAEKTPHDFDFANVHGPAPRKVAHWLELHFLEPQTVSPGSIMPPVRSEKEAAALTAYMLSRREKLGGAIVYRSGDAPTDTAVDGDKLYLRYCAACHGADGRASEVRSIDTPALNNHDFLAVAGDDYLRSIIASGRSGTTMPSWSEGAGNLSRAEIDRIVAHIRGWEPSGARVADVRARDGDAKQGASYYRGLCAGCHGAAGEGGIGNALRAPTFLAIADDRMLARSIIQGRPGTAMPSWRHLSAQTVSDILAFIRTWQAPPPSYGEVRAAMVKMSDEMNVRFGRAIYASRCAACHGPTGEGRIGPSVVSEDFLRIVDDRYLYRAIVEGRPSTAMPAWTHLSADDVGALIAFLRSHQKGPTLTLDDDVARGDYNVGRVLYGEACVACHGVRGAGSVGPQLTNSVFLDAASDAMLHRWISHGRGGTAMKGFGSQAEGPVSLDDREIVDIIAYLRHVGEQGEAPLQRLGIGRPDVGARVYADACASCHGLQGEGASGPQLANPAFLDVVSDGFLAATVVLGRTGTAMQAMVHGSQGLGQIAPESVQDLVAFLRTWEEPRTWRPTRPVVESSASAVDAGSEAYERYCAGCHGRDGLGSGQGDGQFAPALNNAEFLAAASDGFLLATIARGRAGTAMRPFGRGSGGIADLSPDTISNIVSFIRSWHPASVDVATVGGTNEEG